VAIITGAGRGLGREHALFMASEGARVVVNDRGVAMDGRGQDSTLAAEVVAEITALGGEAVANDDDVASWEGGRRLVDMALDRFGDLNVLVNNAGILRDRALVNMTEDEWDDVIAVHLKGHFVPTRHAAAYWRAQAKTGAVVAASVVNTSSTSGLVGNPFQTNYGAAKAGVAAFTIIAAQELGRYGVRVNCVVPAARTRLTSATEGLRDIVKEPSDGAKFDLWNPANVSPVVGWLATERCPATGKVFFVQGGEVRLMTPWAMGEGVEGPQRWTIDALADELGKLVGSTGEYRADLDLDLG
jgi:NAD(P)-dependent dehydrogenase (short-subunit alcohol dehydrogenase family)